MLLLQFWASNWLRDNTSQVTQPQPGFTPLAIRYTSRRVLRLNRRSCILFIYQGDSGGPLYKFNETAHKAVLGSFIDSRHLNKVDATNRCEAVKEVMSLNCV